MLNHASMPLSSNASASPARGVAPGASSRNVKNARWYSSAIVSTRSIAAMEMLSPGVWAWSNTTAFVACAICIWSSTTAHGVVCEMSSTGWLHRIWRSSHWYVNQCTS